MSKIVFLLSILPLIGIIQMEYGDAYGLSIGQPGQINGATYAYATFIFIMLTIFFIFKNKSLNPFRKKNYYCSSYPTNFTIKKTINKKNINVYLKILLVYFVFLLIILVYFGAWKIFAGEERGYFRANLPAGAALYYMILYCWAPGIFAYLTFLHLKNQKKNLPLNIIYYTNAAILSIIAISTGFKTTLILVFLPSFLISNWSISSLKLLKAIILIIPIIFLSTYLVEGISSISENLSFIFTRSTVLLGDVSWYTWDLYKEGLLNENVNLKPFLSIFGDTFIRFITNNNLENIISYDFSLTLHETIGIPLEVVRAGHNVQGTPFSMALILFGSLGLIIIPILQGMLLAYIHNQAQKNLSAHNSVASSIWLTYISFYVFSWLQGGLPTTLIHIAMIPSFFTLYVFLKTMRRKYEL